MSTTSVRPSPSQSPQVTKRRLSGLLFSAQAPLRSAGNGTRYAANSVPSALLRDPGSSRWARPLVATALGSRLEGAPRVSSLDAPQRATDHTVHARVISARHAHALF